MITDGIIRGPLCPFQLQVITVAEYAKKVSQRCYKPEENNGKDLSNLEDIKDLTFDRNE